MSSSSSGGAIFRGARINRHALLVTRPGAGSREDPKPDAEPMARPAGEDQPARRSPQGEEPGAAARAEQVIARANAEAQATLARARAEAADLVVRTRQAAHDEGFAEGRKAGYQDGASAARADIERQIVAEITRLRRLVDDAVVDRSELLQAAETDAVRLAIAIASRIIQREVSINETIVLDVVRSALLSAPDESNARVRVHPADKEVLATRWLAETERDGRRYELVADDAIQRGGCIVECASGLVDARVESLLTEIEDAFLG